MHPKAVLVYGQGTIVANFSTPNGALPQLGFHSMNLFLSASPTAMNVRTLAPPVTDVQVLLYAQLASCSQVLPHTNACAELLSCK